MLKFESFAPTVLTEFIESFDYYYEDNHLDEHSQFLLLPNGKVHLLFQFGTTIKHKTAFTKDWQDRPDTFIGGPFDKGYGMKFMPCSKVFSVTFKPSMAKYFIPIPISELKNQLVNPTDIWGKESKYVIEKLIETESNKIRAVLLEHFLFKKFSEVKPSSIEQTALNIIDNQGVGKTYEYAQAANLSISRYRKKFTDEIGFSPKVFQKLTRINAITKFCKENPSVSFTSVAHQFNYFDQSHFIKDFKSVTGFTPHLYFQNRRFLLF